MRIDYVVMGHERRSHWFDILRDELGDVQFAIDTDVLKLGTWRNCKRAWELIDPEADYGFVIQDDAILCRDFKARVEQFVTKYPNQIYQLYYGNRPTMLPYLKPVDGLNVTYLQWGLAIGLPQHHIQPMIQHADSRPAHHEDDQRIKHYANSHNIKAYYPYPSLVDHRPGQTLVGKYNIMNRQAINFIDKETI